MNCSKCGKNIWFKKSCDYCDKIFCGECIEKHECSGEKNMAEEKVECKNCGKKMNEGDEISCYNCSDNFCNDCIEECEECSESFCETCYSDSNHECEVGFEIIIGFKNSNDKFTFNFSNKKEAKDIFQKFVTAVKNKELFIEHEDALIEVNEIKYVDLRL